MPKGRIRHDPSIVLDKRKLEASSMQHSRLSLVDSIFEMIVDQIQSRHLTPGGRVHSVRQLADSCEVSRDTVVRAYDKLVAHGYLESRAGSGFYVTQTRRSQTVQDAAATAPLLPAWRRLRLIQPVGERISTTGLGLLPDEWMDTDGIGSALRSVARANSRSLTGYADPLGYLPLRQQLQEKLKGVQIQAPLQQIMTTQGATDAVHLVVMSYLSTPGEFVLVEGPGPFMQVDRLMATGLQPVPVPREADGPDVAAMRDLCATYRPRFFFCSSVLHNPTSTQIAPHKAYQILRLAEEFNLIIIEDDTYSDLMPATANMTVTRLASLDQLQRVIYIGSFSKTIASGFRVGFVCANPDIMERLLVYKTVSQISNSPVIEKNIYQILSQGSYRHHCTQLRNRLDELRQPVINQLETIGCSVEHTPDAGMYVWARLPGGADAEIIAETMYQQGHLMAPGMLFAGIDANHDKMRFNIGRTLDSPALPALARLLKA